MNTSNILAALEIMGKGMEGIFVTILIIMVCVWLMEIGRASCRERV